MLSRNRIYLKCVLPFLEEHLRVEGFPFDSHYQLPNYVFNRYYKLNPEIPPRQLSQLNAVVVEPKHLVCASPWFASDKDIVESDSLIYWRGAKHLPNDYVRSLILILTESDKFERVENYLKKHITMKAGPKGGSLPYPIRGHISAMLNGRGASSFVATLMIVDTFARASETYKSKLSFDLQMKFKFQKVLNALLSLDSKESWLVFLTDEEVDVLDETLSQWESDGIYGDTKTRNYEKVGRRRSKILLRLAHMDLMMVALAPLMAARLCAYKNPMPASFPDSFNWSTTDPLEAPREREASDVIRDLVTRFTSRWIKNERKMSRFKGLQKYDLPPIQENNFEWAFVVRPAELLLKGEIPSPELIA